MVKGKAFAMLYMSLCISQHNQFSHKMHQLQKQHTEALQVSRRKQEMRPRCKSRHFDIL